MRRFGFLISLVFSFLVQAQVGEVTNEEIVIEKDKEIKLPPADKLYLPVTLPDLKRDSIRLSFNVSSPSFNISPYAPKIVPFGYAVTGQKLEYQNFFKFGYGAYGSPLLSGYAGEQNKKLSWGAWVHHESFAKGSVRDKQSASSTSYADIFGTFQNKRWAFTPAIGWQSDGSRFYGYDDSDTRATDEKNTINRIRLGATLEEIYDNKATFKVKPIFKSTNQNTPADAPSSQENYFDLYSDGSYQIDSTFSAGAAIQLGAISFTSESTINRNFVKVSPWIGIKRDNLFIKAGVQLASTNDTIISGAKNFFYPDISAEWSGLPGWTIYGSLSGNLKPVTFSDISAENVFMDDSLVMAHENIQTSFGGGIRGAITSKLHLNTGISLSSVKNMSFFIPSPSDSARFILVVDPESITVFNLYGQLNWQPAVGTHLGLRTDILGYTSKTFEEAWYKPGFKLAIDWIQKYTDKISSRVALTSLGGLKAPKPLTLEAETLPTILDLSLEGNYKINNRAEAFVQVQNVFGTEYQRFLNYPGRGIGFRVGALYRF